jgi:hypothetical protein
MPVSTRPNLSANHDFSGEPLRIVANPDLSRAVRNAQESSDGLRGNKPELEKFSQSIRLAYSKYTFPQSLGGSDRDKSDTHAGAPGGY